MCRIQQKIHLRFVSEQLHILLGCNLNTDNKNLLKLRKICNNHLAYGISNMTLAFSASNRINYI